MNGVSIVVLPSQGGAVYAQSSAQVTVNGAVTAQGNIATVGTNGWRWCRERNQYKKGPEIIL